LVVAVVESMEELQLLAVLVVVEQVMGPLMLLVVLHLPERWLHQQIQILHQLVLVILVVLELPHQITLLLVVVVLVVLVLLVVLLVMAMVVQVV
tara:strand:- start:296 stop:577 length:282 start_codon:yes stop_codon:yes gene_type:complete